MLWQRFRGSCFVRHDRKILKQLLNWHLLLHCKPAKIIINHSRSDWFSKAITLVWAEPCVWWAELKMLSFWAGGISSFLPCAREYRLLRRLAKPCPPPPLSATVYVLQYSSFWNRKAKSYGIKTTSYACKTTSYAHKTTSYAHKTTGYVHKTTSYAFKTYKFDSWN